MTETPEFCPNCYSILPEEARYCSHCGQKRIHPEDHSTWHFIVESVGDFFHVDSRFLSTIRPLLFRPGFLTLEFLAGRRARYFEPFKLFLFISFLYFLTSGIMEHSRDTQPLVPLVVGSPGTDVTQTNDLRLTLDAEYSNLLLMPEDSLRRLVKKEGLSAFLKKRYPDASWYTRFMLQRVVKTRLDGADSFRNNLEKTIPKLVFILIPVFALVLKLLYRKRKIFYFNHVLFSLHILAFYFLVSWLRIFLELIASWMAPVITSAIAIYLFFALKRVYRDRYWKTFWKFLLLFLSALAIVGVFLILAGMISFALV